MVEEHGVENANRFRKQDLVSTIIRRMMEQNVSFICSNALEILSDGFGFLYSADISYLAGPNDIYTSPMQVRRFNLYTGDTIKGSVRVSKNNERCFALVRLDTIDGDPPEVCEHKILFENLTPLFPTEQFKLERDIRAEESLTGRAIGLVSLIGKGQCASLAVPPRTGKTVMLQNIAHATTTNYSDAELAVPPVDERPEEVTEMGRSVRGEVVSSTSDEPARHHVQVVEMAIEKTKCMAGHKKDAVILLDSTTRLARAYNTVVPAPGKISTGGVDANTLYHPKRFFSVAYNVEKGGSLTIIATTLVEIDSRMDDVIYEEFKGTDNVELHLDRRTTEKRLLSATSINKPSMRREELLVPNDRLQRMQFSRKFLHPTDEIEAAEFLAGKLKDSKNNDGFSELIRGK